MQVDIWSDVRCPFCYIGKHQFEKALEQFSSKEKIEVIWHSFELDPNLKTDPATNTYAHLAENKGISIQDARQMTQYAANAAAKIGLHFNFDIAIVANSFRAHRLIQLAKTKALSNEVEEHLFKAHFIDGKNIDDEDVLISIGKSIGLKEEEIMKMFASNAYEAAVRQDERQAQELGIRGVPFFVFNHKYAVSGAQSPAVFLQALQQSWNEFEQERKPLIIQQGESCSPDGNCK